jgi:hypothetical protein
MRFAWWSTVAALGMVGGCTSDGTNVVRGKGLALATLPAESQAKVYQAAVKGAFDVDESLSLLLDSRLLPRGVGLAPEGRMTDTVAAELRRIGLTRGTCEPPLQGVKGPPHCAAALPGYVVRFSPVFKLGGDSTQVYVYVQKYDTPNSDPSQTMNFERAYQIVHRGDAWSAAREGRVPRELRGAPR